MRIVDMPEFRDKSQVLSFEETTPLIEAVRTMAAKNYGACIILREGKLAGIFSERDLLTKVAANEMDLQRTILRDVMSKNIKTAQADDHVADCLRRMSQGRFRHMPVVDDDQNVLGMLSQGDFVSFSMSDLTGRIGLITGQITKARAAKAPITTSLLVIIYTLAVLLVFVLVENWVRGWW